MTTTNSEIPETPWLGEGVRCCPIVELRQYTLYPGQRDVLIELFEREFIETQEAVGIKVIGTFRREDAPDQFVWLRGFPGMEDRLRSLKTFYSGPIWKEHRNTANATMIDSDNVLLLHPASPASGFSLEGLTRNPVGGKLPGGLVVANIYYFNAVVSTAFLEFFENLVKPVLAETGVNPLAVFASEESPNTFPALPVREGEYVFVWFASFADGAVYERHLAQLAASQKWQDTISEQLAAFLVKEPEVLRLIPTARSLFKG
ncbi:MAG TPA: NIPSNAP family protein [Chloroflexia bacterium]|nr:NIPSNAP family protein [Chloroflexia bacterium]